MGREIDPSPIFLEVENENRWLIQQLAIPDVSGATGAKKISIL